jgi:hypothetical protein
MGTASTILGYGEASPEISSHGACKKTSEELLFGGKKRKSGQGSRASKRIHTLNSFLFSSVPIPLGRIEGKLVEFFVHGHTKDLFETDAFKHDWCMQRGDRAHSPGITEIASGMQTSAVQLGPATVRLTKSLTSLSVVFVKQ